MRVLTDQAEFRLKIIALELYLIFGTEQHMKEKVC